MQNDKILTKILTVALILKSGKVSKISFNKFSCFQVKKENDDKAITLKKIFSTENNSVSLSKICDIIGYAMITKGMYLKFENSTSSFVLDINDVSGVEITE